MHDSDYASAAMFVAHHHIPAIVRPTSTGEVQEGLRIANRWKVPVYPISSGRIWGPAPAAHERCHSQFLTHPQRRQGTLQHSLWPGRGGGLAFICHFADGAVDARYSPEKLVRSWLQTR
jgi:hypothetical protein